MATTSHTETYSKLNRLPFSDALFLLIRARSDMWCTHTKTSEQRLQMLHFLPACWCTCWRAQDCTTFSHPSMNRVMCFGFLIDPDSFVFFCLMNVQWASSAFVLIITKLIDTRTARWLYMVHFVRLHCNTLSSLLEWFIRNDLTRKRTFRK